MEIWLYNDPDPLAPFIATLARHCPQLAAAARDLFALPPEGRRARLISLGRGLAHPLPAVRRATAALLFSPPVADELGHVRDLVDHLPHWLPPTWHRDAATRGEVAILASLCGSEAAQRALATALEAAVKDRRLPREHPLPPLSLPGDQRQRRTIIGRLYRRLPRSRKDPLLRRLAAHGIAGTPALLQLAAPPRGTPRHRYWQAACFLLDESWIFPGESPQPPSGRQDLRIKLWGNRSREEIAYLERLIAYQANELSWVDNFARQLSAQTRRVVITLHNATLGAASAWGVASLGEQVPAALAAEFAAAVDQELVLGDRVLEPHGDAAAAISSLFDLWRQRLLYAPIKQDLAALKASTDLRGGAFKRWEADLQAAAQMCPGCDPGDDLPRPDRAENAVRTRLHRRLAWARQRKEAFFRFFPMLCALGATGERWLQAGRLSSFVLPVIDKFFISSQREKDLGYLPRFLALGRKKGTRPIFLLFDDTGKARDPSLKLAVDQWRQQYPFCGIGVFAAADSRGAPGRVVAQVAAASSHIDLFVLRPLSEVHNPQSLEGLLHRRPADFLTPEGYDSSWKDNQAFLYTGTQVAPFCANASVADEFPPAVFTTAGLLPFGTYYRSKLRHLAGRRETPGPDASASSPLDELERRYNLLANLL